MIKLDHKSRKYSPKLNFPATENVLSWSFVQEGDGFIYQNPLITGDSTNVDTLTIDGSTPTYPFAIINGTSYSITITKITNGQTASVTLRTRREIDKVYEINVPDFGAFNGRYLYILKSNGVVEKHDTALFTPANYAGAGVWTSTTLISTITLPTLPNTAKYSTITFVKNGGVEKMIVQGCEINVYKSYASFIRLSDDTVWNLNFTTQNSYTQLVNSTSTYNSTYLKSAVYNYISEDVVFNTTFGGQGQATFLLNLNTLVVTLFGNATTAQELFNNNSTIFCNFHRPCSILPQENLYINAVTKFNTTPATFMNIKSNANNKNVCYNKNINVIYSHGDTTIGRVREFSTSGNMIAQYTFNNGISSGQQPIVGYNATKNEYILIATSVTNNNYAIYKKNTSVGTGYILQAPASGQTYNQCLMKSYYNGNWYMQGNLSLGLRRITIINSDNVIPDFGYYDTDVDVYDMATTQIFD